MDNPSTSNGIQNQLVPGNAVLRTLRKYYYLALSIILVTILSSQLFIFNHLHKQNSDSRIINIAGRQRMLSQRLVKEVLFKQQNKAENQVLKNNIERDLQLWTDSHKALKTRSGEMDLTGNNSENISQKFDELEPIFLNLKKSIQDAITGDSARTDLIYALSEDFLKEMDSIVFMYDGEASKRVAALKKIEIIFLCISILVLILEILFIFRPATKYTGTIIEQLSNAENEARVLASQNNQLYKDLEISTEELRAMNYALDHTTMFASLDNGGKVKYISEKFKLLLQIKGDATGKNMVGFLTRDNAEAERFHAIFKNMKSSVWYDEIEVVSPNGQEKVYLDLRLVPVYRFGMRFELFMICSDITKRVLATQELNRLNQEKYESELKEQKSRSTQILNAQEEERKRIARDMHDGIGQMLTALKFNVEALSFEEDDPNADKLREINALSKSIIREVRTTTFNLTPPELLDYGIVAAIKKMAANLQKLTGKHILVTTEDVQDLRFDEAKEINLYRIVQEAVNNALKYSESSVILIKISKSTDILSISVIDDGVGFDLSRADKHEAGSGKGITNMKERASMINARFFISTEENTGTKITINLPLNNLV